MENKKKNSILLLAERVSSKYKSNMTDESDNEDDDGESVPQRGIIEEPQKVRENPKKYVIEERPSIVVPSTVWEALELFTRQKISECEEEAKREYKKYHETRDDI